MMTQFEQGSIFGFMSCIEAVKDYLPADCRDSVVSQLESDLAQIRTQLNEK